MATYKKTTPTYYDENGVLHEGMTQQEYEDQRISQYNQIRDDYLNARNQMLGNGKTMDQTYQTLRSLIQSDKFTNQSPERQQAILAAAKEVEDQLGYTYFNNPSSAINRWDDLSWAGVNRNKFAQKYGYNDWMDLYNNIGVQQQNTPRSIYDTSIRNTSNNPLANLTENQINALAFQAAAGTEFNDQKDLAGVINQINQWNWRGNDWNPVNNKLPAYESNNQTSIYDWLNRGNNGYNIGNYQWASWSAMTPAISDNTWAPLASGIYSMDTSIAPTFWEMWWRNITGNEPNTPQHIKRTQWGTSVWNSAAERAILNKLWYLL